MPVIYRTRNGMQNGYVTIAGRPVPIINGMLTVPDGTVIESANLEIVVQEKPAEETPTQSVNNTPSQTAPAAPVASPAIVTPVITPTVAPSPPAQDTNLNTTENK